MSEESPKNDGNPEFREHKDGVYEIYSNFFDLGWGPSDVYLRLGHLVPVTHENPARFVAEIRATVNMTWAQAKLLRELLSDAIERYEVANGELKWPELATQNLQEAREAQAKQLLMSTSVGTGKAN